MLYAGLDLSRQRLDVHVMDEDGSAIEVTAARPDADALRTLAAVVSRHGQPVTGVVESMNGARFIHDQLERWDWDVEVADAVKVKGLAPLAAKTDKIDAKVLAELARRDVCGHGIDGVARFDGETWSRFLQGRCIESMDTAADGSIWLLASKTDARFPLAHVYVITPEAVAGAE